MANQSSRQLDVYEVLDKFTEQTSRKDKIKVLQENATPALKDILRGTFDEVIKWQLPGGKPPFEPNVPESVPSSLQKQNTQFTYFVKGGRGRDLPQYKREKIFIGVLESIHPADAAVVISMINKKPHVKGLTKKIVEEAFPGLIIK